MNDDTVLIVGGVSKVFVGLITAKGPFAFPSFYLLFRPAH